MIGLAILLLPPLLMWAGYLALHSRPAPYVRRVTWPDGSSAVLWDTGGGQPFTGGSASWAAALDDTDRPSVSIDLARLRVSEGRELGDGRRVPATIEGVWSDEEVDAMIASGLMEMDANGFCYWVADFARADPWRSIDDD